jgi:hypothetical protein
VKVIFAGSRTVKDASLPSVALCNSPWLAEITEVVHGGCRGVDSLAHDAFDGLFPVKVFPADWKAHGRAAGPIRNREMAQYADALIAIWDGKSRGTANMIEEMKRIGKPVYVWHIPA